MIFVTGGSGSGKSKYAEQLAVKEAAKRGADLYYLATMRIFDEEDEKKADRHRKMRAGKGFETIESPTNIDEVADRVNLKNAVVLLECISNLTANEMFKENDGKYECIPADRVTEKIVRDVQKLEDSAAELVVVSDDIFCGGDYGGSDESNIDGGTKAYAVALGDINARLAEMSDEAWEVIAGISVSIK